MWGSVPWVKKVNGSWRRRCPRALVCPSGSWSSLLSSCHYYSPPCPLSHGFYGDHTLFGQLIDKEHSSGWHPKPFWTWSPLTSLPLPVRSLPYGVLGSGMSHWPWWMGHIFSLLPSSRSCLLLQALTPHSYGQTCEGQTWEAFPETRQNEWLPALHFVTVSMITFITTGLITYRSVFPARMVGTWR